MSKITPSALIGTVSGKAGGVVFGTWRGQAYVRTRVTPKMGMAEGQVAARLAMQLLNPRFRSLQAWNVKFKPTWDFYAAGLRKSGWNRFCEENVKDEITKDMMLVAPELIAVAHTPTLVDAGGGAAGSIVLTWDAGDFVVGDTIYFALCKQEDDTLIDGGSATADLETKTIVGLEAGEKYAVWATILVAAATYLGKGSYVEGTAAAA